MDTPSSQQPPLTGTTVPGFDAKDVADNKLWAMLSYVSFVSLIVLFTKKDSKFAEEHAKQGVILFVVELVWYILMSMPFLWLFLLPVSFIFHLLFLIVSLYAIYQAYQGKFWEIPVIGALRKNVKV